MAVGAARLRTPAMFGRNRVKRPLDQRCRQAVIAVGSGLCAQAQPQPVVVVVEAGGGDRLELGRDLARHADPDDFANLHASQQPFQCGKKQESGRAIPAQFGRDLHFIDRKSYALHPCDQENGIILQAPEFPGRENTAHDVQHLGTQHERKGEFRFKIVLVCRLRDDPRTHGVVACSPDFRAFQEEVVEKTRPEAS